MNQALTRELTTELEKVIIGGDLAKMTPAERLNFYSATCKSLGLNPLTRPFEYITLNGKLTLYARKDATEQLRAIHGISITKLEREVSDGVYCVTSYLINKDGRQDSSLGAVSIEGLKGEAKANAMMKAETKSKRRGTLSICGLGMLDETEVETIPSAQPFVERTEPPKAELPPVTYDKAELELATAALQTLLAHPVFSDTDRIACSQWLKKKPGLDKIKAKLAEKKALLIDNPDADVVRPEMEGAGVLMSESLTLYDLETGLAEAAERLFELQNQPETPQDIEEALAILETYITESVVKRDNCGRYLQSLDATNDAIDNQIAWLQEKQKRIRKRRTSFSNYLLFIMYKLGVKKLEGTVFSFRARQNPVSVVIEDESKIPAEYKRQPETPAPIPDKKAIKDALIEGKQVPGAALKQETRLVIDQ